MFIFFLLVTCNYVIRISAHDFEDTFDEANHIDVTCQQQTNISDLENQLSRLSNGIVSEEVLCFLKCRLLKKNYMSEDGVIYPELIKKKFLQYMRTFDKSLDCLETIPPIVTCGDVENLVKCVNG